MVLRGGVPGEQTSPVGLSFSRRSVSARRDMALGQCVGDTTGGDHHYRPLPSVCEFATALSDRPVTGSSAITHPKSPVASSNSTDFAGCGATIRRTAGSTGAYF